MCSASYSYLLVISLSNILFLVLANFLLKLLIDVWVLSLKLLSQLLLMHLKLSPILIFHIFEFFPKL